MRLLHLLEPRHGPPREVWLAEPLPRGSDAACLTLANLVARGGEHAVVTVGTSDAKRRAAELGVRAAAHVAPPFGRVSMCAPGVQAATSRLAPPDVIVIWGERLAPLADAAGGAPSLTVSFDGFGRSEGSAVDLGEWIGAELPVDRPCHAPEKSDGRSRIALLGDGPKEGGAVEGVTVTLMLRVMNVHAVCVAPSEAGQLRRGVRMAAESGRSGVLEICQGSALTAALGCDAAVITLGPGQHEPSPGALISASALMARGVPVVGTGAGFARLAGPAGAWLTARDAHPASLARTLLRVLDVEARQEASQACMERARSLLPAARKISTLAELLSAGAASPKEGAARG